MTERALQAKVLKNLRLEYGYDGVWINKSPSQWDKKGISDIIGVFKGHPFAIELKKPGAYKGSPAMGLSIPQAEFLLAFSRAGGSVIVTDDWGVVSYYLDARESTLSETDLVELIALLRRRAQEKAERSSSGTRARTARQ